MFYFPWNCYHLTIFLGHLDRISVAAISMIYHLSNTSYFVWNLSLISYVAVIITCVLFCMIHYNFLYQLHWLSFFRKKILELWQITWWWIFKFWIILFISWNIVLLSSIYLGKHFTKISFIISCSSINSSLFENIWFIYRS